MLRFIEILFPGAGGKVFKLLAGIFGFVKLLCLRIKIGIGGRAESIIVQVGQFGDRDQNAAAIMLLPISGTELSVKKKSC